MRCSPPFALPNLLIFLLSSAEWVNINVRNVLQCAGSLFQHGVRYIAPPAVLRGLKLDYVKSSSCPYGFSRYSCAWCTCPIQPYYPNNPNKTAATRSCH